jgi:hypothetical protein
VSTAPSASGIPSSGHRVVTGVGDGVGDAVGEGDGVGVGDGVGEAVGGGVGDGVGAGVAVAMATRAPMRRAATPTPPAAMAWRDRRNLRMCEVLGGGGMRRILVR